MDDDDGGDPPSHTSEHSTTEPDEVAVEMAVVPPAPAAGGPGAGASAAGAGDGASRGGADDSATPPPSYSARQVPASYVSVAAAEVLPVLQGTVIDVISQTFTPGVLEVKKDVPFDLYFNPTYGAVSPTQVTRRGTQVRQLVLQKAGARERLRHVYGNLKDKEDKKQKWEQYANYCYIASELVLYVILGWCASQVVQYQEKYVENEYAYCFVFSTTNLKDGDRYNDDAVLAAFDANLGANPYNETCGVHAVTRGGAYCSRLFVGADFKKLDDDAFDDEVARPAWGDRYGSADNALLGCPDLSTLPSPNVIYAAAVIYTFCKLMNAICTFFSTKFENEWLFKIHGVYYHAEKLVENFAEKLYETTTSDEQRKAVDSLRLPELVPKARDDALLLLGLFEIACVCIGNWLISRGDVVVGLIMTVLAAMAIALTIHKHVTSQREITYLTWETVDRIVSWANAAFVPAIDPHNFMHRDLMSVRAEIEIPSERDSNDNLEIETRLKQLVAKRVTELGLPQDEFNFPATASDFLDMAIQASDDSARENLGNYMPSAMKHPEKKAIQIVRGKFRDRAGKSYDQMKKGEWKRDFENWARIFDGIGFVVLFGFLGIAASQVVDFQHRNTPNGWSSMVEYCACFEEECTDSDLASTSRQTEVSCPDHTMLPNEYLVYFSAGGHAALLIISVIFTFFSRDATNQEMARTRSTFGMVLSTAYKGEEGAQLDLIPDDMNIPMICLMIVMIVLIGVGNWLISKNFVSGGLILAVLAARGFAYFASEEIQTKAATDLATYQFVERCAKMTLMCPTLTQDDQKTLLVRIDKLEDSRSLMKKPPGVQMTV